jgi:hypothetical protein
MIVEKSHDFDAAKLHNALGGYDDFFRQEIEQGIAELWKINYGESYCVSRLEYDEYKQKTILVLCCYQGKNITQFARHCERIADKNDWQIRVHTENETLAKLYQKKMGFGKPEYVLIREPKNG